MKSSAFAVQFQIILLSCLLLHSYSALYEYSSSRVVPLRQDNFDKLITKHREKEVSIVHYYQDNYENRVIKVEIEKLAEDYQGVFFIGAVDCGVSALLCESKQGYASGSVAIYPPNPIPAFQFEGTKEKIEIIKIAARFVPTTNVFQLNDNNIDTWISDKPSVPKVLLFSDKSSSPLIYNALSNDFVNKLLFGFVQKSNDAIVKRYKIKDFPKIMVLKGNAKPDFYKGGIRYQDIFDYLNIFSETFVYGGGAAEESAVSKPWLSEAIPEIYRESADDICLKAEALCVIFCSTDGIDSETYDVMKRAQGAFVNNPSPKFKFMWLNIQLENFHKAFQTEGEDLNHQVVILNPGKRKRFTKHEGNIRDLEATLTRIVNGDAKFKMIKDELPSFAYRKK